VRSTALQRAISGFVISDENNWFLEKAIVKPCASLAIVETKQIVLPIELCARVKSNQLSYQLWFVEWENKTKGKTNWVLWNWGKKEIVLPIVVCWNWTKKTMTKPSATLLKRNKGNYIKRVTKKQL